MTYREGNKVIYPRLGICRVSGVVEQSAGGTVVKCYSLKPLESQDSTTILVPVSKADDIGVRKLIDKA
ncbi:MAG: CarD-like/TRCF domain, partial [Acidobacteriota bacterium]